MNKHMIKRWIAAILLMFSLLFVYSYGKDILYNIVLPSGYPKLQLSSDYRSMSRKLDKDHVMVTDVRFYKGGPGLTVECRINSNCSYDEAYAVYEDLRVILDDSGFIRAEICRNNKIPGNSYRCEILFLDQWSEVVLYKAISQYQVQKIDDQIRDVQTFDWTFVDCRIGNHDFL